MDADYPGMTSLVERRHKRMVENADCQLAPRCIVEGWKISADEQKIIGERLEALVSNTSLGHSYDKAQWYRYSNALNYILSVYGEGAPPHYPAIDAMSLDSASKDFVHLIAGLQAQRLNDQDTERTIFTDPLYYASILLDANDRDDAIHFPDLWEKWNAQPLQRSHRLRWRQYSYAAIIVPGAGPEAADTALSALGKFRLMVAVESYKKELAPFIIVSGGSVHPARTRYVEAEEMRRVLMQRFGIPEQSIVMEPYARHTTTNLRNASRVLQTLGAPSDMPSLIVTDPDQSAYISSSTFSACNQRELGCQPGTLGKRLSAFAIAFYLAMACSKPDPNDPLDP